MANTSGSTLPSCAGQAVCPGPQSFRLPRTVGEFSDRLWRRGQGRSSESKICATGHNAQRSPHRLPRRNPRIEVCRRSTADPRMKTSQQKPLDAAGKAIPSRQNLKDPQPFELGFRSAVPDVDRTVSMRDLVQVREDLQGPIDDVGLAVTASFHYVVEGSCGARSEVHAYALQRRTRPSFSFIGFFSSGESSAIFEGHLINLPNKPSNDMTSRCTDTRRWRDGSSPGRASAASRQPSVRGDEIWLCTRTRPPCVPHSPCMTCSLPSRARDVKLKRV